jgi:hypothetical protein
MLHFDEGGELKRAFLLTAVERNKNPQLRIRALQEIAASRDAEAFDRAIEMIAGWPRDEKREGVKVVLQSLAEKKIGRRDQANNWIWACAEMTREVHEEYAVQRWPETKRLLGLLVNSSGGAHARNARRLVHAARQQDRRLAAALLAAALPHTAESGEVINGARTRMSRKPAALARELLRNFPKGKGRRGQRRRKKGKGGGESQAPVEAVAAAAVESGEGAVRDADPDREEKPKPKRSRRHKVDADAGAEQPAAEEAPKPKRSRRRKVDADSDQPTAEETPKPKRSARKRAPKKAAETPAAAAPADAASPAADAPKPKRAPRKRAAKAAASKPKPKRKPAAKRKAGGDNGVPTALERASERVREAVQADAPNEAA